MVSAARVGLHWIQEYLERDGTEELFGWPLYKVVLKAVRISVRSHHNTQGQESKGVAGDQGCGYSWHACARGA